MRASFFMQQAIQPSLPLSLLPVFSNPSVLRTPPLYFAVQNTEEEFKSNPLFICTTSSVWLTPLRNIVGYGKGEEIFST